MIRRIFSNMIILPHDDIERTIEFLQSGQIGIMLCDTIFGIVGAVPETEQAIKDAKGRGEDHPFLQLIDPTWFNTLSTIPFPEQLTPYWPGPLTVITETQNQNTTAFRAPDGDMLHLVQAVDTPIFSTSANLSGTPYHGEQERLINEFEGRVDFFVPTKKELIDRTPSTIINITTNPFTMVRKGRVVIPDHLLQMKY